MIRYALLSAIASLSLLSTAAISQPSSQVEPFILVDQFGYLPYLEKVAVIKNPVTGFDAARSFAPGATYQLRRWADGAVVASGAPVPWRSGATYQGAGDQAWWFDFSSITETGSYYVYDVDNDVRSHQFDISPTVYHDVLRVAFKTFYYQRINSPKVEPYAEPGWVDGNNFAGPEQDFDCRLVSNPSPATSKDLSGGWFDAGDYNKYVNFTADPVQDLLYAYTLNPAFWTDDFNLPESGNGIPDLIDELKYELDWLLKMQLEDGSMLHKVSATQFGEGSPPSSDNRVRRYAPATASATGSGAVMFAHAALVYQDVPGMTGYAATLRQAAIDAFAWILANPGYSYYDNAGFANAAAEESEYYQLARRISASVYLFDLTGEAQYKNYFDANWENLHLFQWYYIDPYESHFQNAALHYAALPGADPTIAGLIRSRYTTAVDVAFNFGAVRTQDDPFRAFLTTSDEDGGFGNTGWGSNHIKADQANLYMNMVTYGMAADPDEYTQGASGYINYMHGVNPLGLAYLTNMAAYGAENSANTMYHSWFSDGSALWDDVRESTYGPPPGYLPGGPNPNFTPDATYGGPPISPPQGQPALKAYLDWNTSYPQNSWEVTEPAIYYQTAYIKLLAQLIRPVESSGIPVSLSISMQGPWATGAMATDLDLPLAQPYSASPWDYQGAESVTQAFLDSRDDIVDWVLIGLRTTPDGPSLRAAGLLLEDGTIVSVDGGNPATLPAVPGDYFVTVYHRNHLAIQSPAAVTLGN